MKYKLKERGIVLRSHDYGEGHRIVIIYTPGLGKVRASARGSRKTDSRYGSMLEPFSENEFIFYRKPNSEIYTLTGSFPLFRHSRLRDDMNRYKYGALIAEGTDILSPEEDPQENIYALLKEALRDSCDKNPATSAWLFLFRLLKQSGYRLNMFSCFRCTSRASGPMLFIPGEGGVCCRGCFGGEKNSSTISGIALEEIRKLSPEREINLKIEKEIGNIIFKFVKYQFDREFKSRGFIKLFNKEKNVLSGFNTKT